MRGPLAAAARGENMSITKENHMDIDTHDELETGLETKAGIPSDAVVTHAELMRAFEEFKEANDRKARHRSDVVLNEKLARIDQTIDVHSRRLDEIALKSVRPSIGNFRSTASSSEHKAAFEAYVRVGENTDLRALESKALSAGSGPDGGFLVPPEIETQIGQRLIAISPIRSIAGMRTISSNVYKKPFLTTGPAVGWVGETEVRPQTVSPALDELTFPAMELYAMPAATATLLEDAAVNVGEWLGQEVEQVFAAQEGTAFVNGDGNNKPKGFLSYGTVANTAWGKSWLHRIGSGRRISSVESFRRPSRPYLFPQSWLSTKRRLCYEPQNAECSSEVQRHDRQLSLAAARCRGRKSYTDDVSCD